MPAFLRFEENVLRRDQESGATVSAHKNPRTNYKECSLSIDCSDLTYLDGRSPHVLCPIACWLLARRAL
jgi:hypothetical protein